jgi:hypothetical protein
MTPYIYKNNIIYIIATPISLLIDLKRAKISMNEIEASIDSLLLNEFLNKQDIILISNWKFIN